MMLKNLIKKAFLNSKEILFYESRQMQGFMQLLMKPRNTGERWSREDRIGLRNYFKYMSLYIPFLIIFLMPGGLFFLPIFSSILDRRRVKRVSCEVPVFTEGKAFNSWFYVFWIKKMIDRKVDKLVREAIERLHKDNAIFCENPSFCHGIRDRIREQIENMKCDNYPK